MIAAAVAAIALAIPTQLPLPPLPELPPLPPLPPPPCLVPPCEPPPPLPDPPPTDAPPTFAGVVVATVTGRYVVLDWPPARDDIRIWGYRIYRDGIVIARRDADHTRIRLRLPCGRHRYRIEAVDSSQQVVSISRRVARLCPP